MKRKTENKDLLFKKFSPRIIIKFQDSLNLPYNSESEIEDFLSKNEILPMKELSKKFPGIKIKKLFTSVEPKDITKLVNKARALNPKYQPPNFFTYCIMDCPYKTDTYKLVQEIRKSKNVEFAYVENKPAPPPGIITGSNPMNTSQGYLDPAPKGINARYAWQFNGGLGEGQVKFIDIEYAWILEHEDIKNSGVRFLWGERDVSDFSDHGTSVLGIILMQDNEFGGLGITPKVKTHVVSQINPDGDNSVYDAIVNATANLDFGDILLLEVQASTAGVQGDFYWPTEIEPPIFHVIELATNNGIIVIEAAGNGDSRRGSKLDNFADESGKKILERASDDFKDSGAIIVGAASATNAHGKVRSSNYGNRVDCFGWGTKVFTADDPAKDLSRPPYRDNFSETSSASAIIAGAAIVVQSIAEASGKQRLSAIEMRDILSNPTNGTPSRNAIGIMPDLKEIIDNVIPGLR